MAKTRTPKRAANAIDPRGETTVLTYVGPGLTDQVPARDLHGNDIARQAYLRAFHAVDWTVEGAKRPGEPTDDELQAVVDSLVRSGNYVIAEQTDEAEQPATADADNNDTQTTPETPATAEG